MFVAIAFVMISMSFQTLQCKSTDIPPWLYPCQQQSTVTHSLNEIETQQEYREIGRLMNGLQQYLAETLSTNVSL